MRVFLSAAMAAGLALPLQVAPTWVLPALATVPAFTCASLPANFSTNTGVAVQMRPGDQLLFSGTLELELGFGAGNITSINGPVFTARQSLQHVFYVPIPGGAIVPHITFNCVVGGAAPALTTAPLPGQTIWQQSQHRDDTQQRGIQNAVSNRFSDSSGGDASASQNSLNIVSSFAALDEGSTQSDTALGSLGRIAGSSLNQTMDTRWDAWVSGRFDIYNGDSNGPDGTMVTGVVGVDYLLTEAIVLGGFAGYNVSDFDINATNTVESGAFSIGTYAGFNFYDALVAEVFAAYSFLDYDVQNGAVTGDFNADSVALGLSLYGTVPLQGAFTLEPTVRAKYNGEWHEAYVDSAGTAVGNQSFNSVRLSAGGRLYYDGLVLQAGTVRPWVGAMYEYALSDTASQEELGYGEAALGVISTFDRFQIEVSADVGGLGSGQYTRYGGDARLGVRF